MKACIKYGVAHDSTACDNSATVTTSPSSTAKINFPENDSGGWEDLVSSGNSRVPTLSSLEFTTSHIVAYFVARSVCDNQPAGDIKSINKSAEYLFKCGHVQSIQFATSDSHLLFKAKCLPEMRKDRVYIMKMALLKKVLTYVMPNVGVQQEWDLKVAASILHHLHMHW